MAEEAVVKEALTEKMIRAGEELICLLDQAQLEVDASLWFYMPESNTWRLMIASPEVAKYGPKKVYEKIRSVLSQRSEEQPSLALRDISVVEDTNPLISLLRSAVRTDPGISGIRFSRNAISGHFIDDAYIYRM